MKQKTFYWFLFLKETKAQKYCKEVKKFQQIQVKLEQKTPAVRYFFMPRTLSQNFVLVT